MLELGAFASRGHVRQVVFEEPAEPPRPSRIMTDAEVEDAKAALLMELAKLYDTTTDLIDVQTWTEGTDTSIHYKVEFLTTGVLPDPPRAPRMMTDAEIEDAKTALLMDLAKLYNTTTDLLHVQTWTDGNDTRVLSSATQVQLSTTYIVRLSSTPMVGSTSTSASVTPTSFAVDGYNGQSFLRFSKTSATTGNQYLAVSGPRRSSDQL